LLQAHNKLNTFDTFAFEAVIVRDERSTPASPAPADAAASRFRSTLDVVLLDDALQ